MNNQTITFGQTVNLNSNIYTREGYTFEGWSHIQNGGAEYGDHGPYTMEATDTTLYAIWTPIEYDIYYNLNGGTNNPQNPTTYNIESNFNFADAQKLGYHQDGWYKESNFDTRLDSITPGMMGDINLYANWIKNTYTVTFDKQGGSGGTNTVDVAYTDAMPSGKNAPIKTGYAFTGYYDEHDNKYYDADMISTDVWDIAANGTLYAHWTAQSYIVTLDLQGGVGEDSVLATYDEYVPAAPTPTRDGYTFKGYYKEANGVGKQYYGTNMSMLEKWDIASSAILYAYWTINTYSITFMSNGASGTMDNQDIIYNQSENLNANTYTKTGYTFDGWSTSSSGSVEYNNQANFTMSDSDETLWAIWSANTYTITFDKQGGNSGTNTVDVNYDASMSSATAPTKEGYSFDGYYVNTSGIGKKYYDNNMSSVNNWDIDSDTTLYANWIADSYTLTFDKQSGDSIDINSKQITFNQPFGNLATTSKTGYTFDGWYTETNGNGDKIISTTTVDTVGDRTLYAAWTANEYTVTFNSQGGSSANPTTKIVTYDDTYGSLAIITREGYTLDEWNTQVNGSGTTINSSSTVSISNNHTLYAIWTPNTYTVTLDKQGGTGGSDSVVATFDKEMPSASSPARVGYDFVGYFYSPISTSTQYYNSIMNSINIWTISSDITIFAVWEKIDYTISYNLNGGNNNVLNPATYTIESNTINFEVPSRTGYTFNGWYEESTFDTQITQVVNGSHGDITLYAKWTPIVYDITYTLNSGTNNINNPNTYTIETATFDLETPTRDYYDFVGWYKESTFDTEISQVANGSHGDLDLYAKWTPTVYNINYNLNLGTNNVSNPASYTIESSTITFAEPTRSGYYFGGWYTSSALNYINLKQTIEAGSHDSVTLYAKWNELYNVGDTGPKGGKIFIDRNAQKFDYMDYLGDYDYTVEDSWRYMEAALNDVTTTYTWVPSDESPFDNNKRFNNSSDDYNRMGYGKSNTQMVVDFYTNKENHACYAASNHNHGLEGWFLPSQEELSELLNVFKYNLASCNFTIGRSYWTSSDLSWDQAWAGRYNESGEVELEALYYQNKWDAKYIRPVRRF